MHERQYPKRVKNSICAEGSRAKAHSKAGKVEYREGGDFEGSPHHGGPQIPGLV